MKLNEVIVEYEDNNQPLYKRVGIDSPERNAAQAKKNFVNRFVEYIKQNKKATSLSGVGAPNIERMALTYLTKYNWHADSEQQEIIKKLSDEAQASNAGALKLANYMYSLGSQQFIDPRTGVAMGNTSGLGGRGGSGGSGGGGGQGGAGGQGGQAGQTPEVKLEPNTQTVINIINKMNTASHLDDLAQVTKIAMGRLYRMNPSKYRELYKEITTGETQKSPEEIRKEKLKANAAAANASAVPFSKYPQSEKGYGSPSEKQQARFKQAAAAANAEALPFSKLPPKDDEDENPNIIKGTMESRRFYRRNVH